MNISLQKPLHAAVKVQSGVRGPSMLHANISESPHTSVNIKLLESMNALQGNKFK